MMITKKMSYHADYWVAVQIGGKVKSKVRMSKVLTEIV